MTQRTHNTWCDQCGRAVDLARYCDKCTQCTTHCVCNLQRHSISADGGKKTNDHLVAAQHPASGIRPTCCNCPRQADCRRCDKCKYHCRCEVLL